MTTAELDALVLRANNAGHNSIAEYAIALEQLIQELYERVSGLEDELLEMD